jgi:hypothetical protein
MVCSAMREHITTADMVVHAPPAGDGPSFTVKYALPRSA